MFQRLENGWSLAVQSWRVLKCDKELLMFPVFSGIACLLVMASFALPLWATGFAEELADAKENEASAMQQAIGWGVLFTYYFVNYFVIIFFNSALISCAITRFRGGDPTLRDGLSTAMSRLPQIAGWAFVSATVGLLLKLVESRSERVGSIVAGLFGMAWSAVTYFVVPVIVVEQAGPVTAAKRSLQILRKAWGEALTANFGIGIIVTIVSLLGVIPFVLGIMAFQADQAVVGSIAVALGIIVILGVSLVSSAMNAIIVGALFLYASEGKVPQEFEGNLLQQAFRHR